MEKHFPNEWGQTQNVARPHPSQRHSMQYFRLIRLRRSRTSNQTTSSDILRQVFVIVMVALSVKSRQKKMQSAFHTIP